MKTDNIRKKDIKILYEDPFLVAFDKPAGISVTPDRWDDEIPSIMGFFPNLIGIHRLDKETSGVLLFAKNKDAARNLSLQFQNREIEKFYNALVDGDVGKKKGKISLGIREIKKKPGVMTVSKKGKPSVTKFTVIEKFKGFSWLEVELLTGRTHQIRVHLKAIGHPLAVDSTYGNREALYLSEIKPRYRPSKRHPEIPILSRSSLHAQKVSFKHPESDEMKTIISEISKDLRITLNNLRKYESK